jgi:Zn finger protein HypA/HybF involved in hydrogenase expression
VHELSIVMELRRVCLAEIDERHGDRLEAVRVRIGDFSGVEPELLARAWEVACPGVSLEIERDAARCTCPDCGPLDGDGDALVGTWLKPCPRCGAPLRVEGGDALEVIEIEFRRSEELAPQEVSS